MIPAKLSFLGGSKWKKLIKGEKRFSDKLQRNCCVKWMEVRRFPLYVECKKIVYPLGSENTSKSQNAKEFVRQDFTTDSL